MAYPLDIFPGRLEASTGPSQEQNIVHCIYKDVLANQLKAQIVFMANNGGTAPRLRIRIDLKRIRIRNSSVTLALEVFFLR
jgi:hypothetical protein